MAAKADTTAGIRKLWGIAKSPELRLSDEDLHLVVQAHTGKDSIKELNNRELNTCIRVLLNMKDSAKGKNGSTKRRRSGNPATENQRKKVYKLTQELGWEKPARVNGLCMKMFKVSSVEWLNYQQCSPGYSGRQMRVMSGHRSDAVFEGVKAAKKWKSGRQVEENEFTKAVEDFKTAPIDGRKEEAKG